MFVGCQVYGCLEISLKFAVAAAVGGTASEIGGGKFANGARTAAFAHLLNAETTHKVRQAQAEKILEKFKSLIISQTEKYDDLRANTIALSIKYDASYRGLAQIDTNITSETYGVITVGDRFLTARSAFVSEEATVIDGGVKYLESLTVNQSQLFVIRHEVEHLSYYNRMLAKKSLTSPPSRVHDNSEIHATERAIEWSRKTL